jgi:AraC family transcriptional regulator
MNSAMQGSIRTLSSDAMVSSRVACTESVRVEFLRCRQQATVKWNVARPEVSLLWMRDKDANSRIRTAGHQLDKVATAKANFWFFPEGIDAEGELKAESEYDCAGVFVDPRFLSRTAKKVLAKPIVGSSHHALDQAFDGLMAELAGADELLPLFTEACVMQVLAYVARGAKRAQPDQVPKCGGLAPWQLRRAKDLLRASLADNLSMSYVAAACKLSVSHFARAFKASTGFPPQQWVMLVRIETAQRLLVNSTLSLVEVADECGFTDQSHFTRIFGRIAGTSPGMWRREHRA